MNLGFTACSSCSPGAASSLPTTSHPLRPPLPPCRPALRHRRWLRSFPSRPLRYLRPRPTARWTGPTTPTSRGTASVTRWAQRGVAHVGRTLCIDYTVCWWSVEDLDELVPVLQVSYGEMVGCDNTDVSPNLCGRLVVFPALGLGRLL